MPTSIVRSFNDPDQFRSGIRATDVDVSITQAGVFEAKVIRIDLRRLWMQRGFDSLARVMHYNNVPCRAVFSFIPRSCPPYLADGLEHSSATILRYREAASGFHVSAGPAHIATMSLPIADIEALGGLYADADLIPPADTLLAHPDSAAMARLQSLHEDAVRLAERGPEIIARPEAAHALEQALIGALSDCVGGLGQSESLCPSHGRARVMRRLHALLESNPEQVFHVAEVCAILGTSNRTLTTACQETLGLSPHRYFRIRQMNLVRSALLRADAGAVTVTEIATGHGFWELGRFSAAYSALFGELPSVTLRRAADGGARNVNG